MKRRTFIQNATMASSLAFINPMELTASSAREFPTVRTAENERNFKSKAIEKAILKFSKNVEDPKLVWLFNNCFPNTLDTTVTYKEISGRPDTYVITGDIDAMWLRDSSAQVWPYLAFTDQDKDLKKLIAGVINRQTRYILKDPYANAFYDDPTKEGEWASDLTKMLPGVHERKYEIDSLCYPIRLAYNYWKNTGDSSPFDQQWKQAIALILKTFKQQQQKDGPGPYSFMRKTPHATDTRALKGYGYPVKPVGLISSAFRPSDDATVFSFLIPSNFFAVISLKQAAEMVKQLHDDTLLSQQLLDLSKEVEAAIEKHAVVEHPNHGPIYAFEIDGYGNHLLMDDANVPSLLSLPYLGAIDKENPIYQNTRNFVWSKDNPFFFKGKAGEGIGGPHVGMDMIWPMSLSIKALSSTDPNEIKACITSLKNNDGNTGFMHESFHKDDPTDFSRSWFAWANTLFGELLWKTYNENPELL